MKTFATLLATTALLGATALPALAIVLDGTIAIRMYEPTASNVDVNDSTGAATGDGSTSAPSTGATAVEMESGDGVASGDSTGPATGDEVDSGANMAVAAEAESGDGVDSDDTTGPAAGDTVASAPAASAPMLRDGVIVPDSPFNANVVKTAEGTEVGVVEEVVAKDDGTMDLVVLINGGMADQMRFVLTLDQSVAADGEIVLGVSNEQLMTTMGVQG